MAKNRYGRKRGHKKGGHRKNAKRVAAGRKAWRTRVRRYGKARAVAMIGRRKARGGRKHGRRHGARRR
jgi:hypothetical protein